jgi:Arc/MetJ family transcription regulator
MPDAVKSTNIELDRDLLTRARAALGDATIKDTVEEGLRRIVSSNSLRLLAAGIRDMDDNQRELLAEVRDTAW